MMKFNIDFRLHLCLNDYSSSCTINRAKKCNCRDGAGQSFSGFNGQLPPLPTFS